MWIYLALASAVLLGFYDIAKKQALKRNSVMWVLVAVSALSTLVLSPFFRIGPAHDFMLLVPKAFLVATSWISGLIGMKVLPMTTSTTIKASRPVFVVILSMLIFGERLSPMQWAGVLTVFMALWLLSRSSRSEGIIFHKDKGVWWMALSVATGVASALYDKYIMRGLDPMFVLCWSNLFIGLVMAAVLCVRNAVLARKARLAMGQGLASQVAPEHFKWDWYLLLAAIAIIVADYCYFRSLTVDGAMLSIISLIRRFSAVVTFAIGAILFKEKNIKAKSIDLTILMAGIAILVFSS